MIEREVGRLADLEPLEVRVAGVDEEVDFARDDGAGDGEDD